MFASKDSLLTRPSGGYTIARSVRLRQSASAYLNRTPASSGSQTTFTHSIWLKRGLLSSGNYVTIYGSESSGSNYVNCAFYQDCLYWTTYNGTTNITMQTTQVFRDVSAWYHFVIAVDTTQATAANRVKLYVNGTQITAGTFNYPSQNQALQINTSSYVHKLGFSSGFGQYYDGYFAEINFIDGQALTPSSFGSTNTITGVWQPAKYTGTYGTNGFYLNFSSNGTSAALGTDFSGNSNTWTVNNISVTAGATYDSMTDVPTLTSATVANYATMNPLAIGSTGTSTINNGNLSFANGAAHASTTSTIGVTSGKYYLECTVTTSSALGLGITTSTAPYSAYPGSVAGLWWVYDNTGGWSILSQTSTLYSGASKVALNQIWQIALDMDNGKAWIGINNTWYDSAGGTTGNPSTGANPTWSSLPTTSPMFFFIEVAGAAWAATFGQRPYNYTAPTGFVALNTYNLPTSTITNGAAYMAATLYTGNGTTTGNTQSISNAVNSVSFQPDLVWIKSRSAATWNVLTDSVRGANKTLYSNSTYVEESLSNVMNSFNSGGFTAAYNSAYTNVITNANAATYVGWQWKAGAGTTSNITVGQYSTSPNVPAIASTVSANTTAGFSVVTYTTAASGAFTVGHGLGVAPSFIINRVLTPANNWYCYHVSLGNNTEIVLNTTTAAVSAAGDWNSTSPTSTVFSMGSGWQGSYSMVSYCFAPVTGYSAFGSYTGNNSTDGPFVYLGFRPRWVMIKRYDTGNTGSWYIMDTSRDTYNLVVYKLMAESAVVENGGGESTSTNTIDILSNGFKLRSTNTGSNASGGTYIYACFAENPFKNSLAR